MTRAEGARTEGAVFQSAAAGFRRALGRTEEDTDRDPRLAVTPYRDLRSLRDGGERSGTEETGHPSQRRNEGTEANGRNEIATRQKGRA